MFLPGKGIRKGSISQLAQKPSIATDEVFSLINHRNFVFTPMESIIDFHTHVFPDIIAEVLG